MAREHVRLEYLRQELRAERISYGELLELQSLAPFIDPNDTELREVAGLPEHPELVIMYEVHEGRPSWHQQRAGHISAAVTTGFPTREDAEAFAQRLRDHHPHLYVFVLESKQKGSPA